MAEILVIGDDLTGTNATAAMYARDGLSAVTVLGAATPVGLEDQIQVIACSTGSRHLPPAEAALRVRDAVTMLGRPDQVLNKRFDTTLRGNVGAEIEAALETVRKMSPDRRVVGLVVPAFPAAGRSTVGGYQMLDGDPILMGPASTDPFTPVRHSRVAGIIAEQCSLTTTEIGLDCVMSDDGDLASALRRAAQHTDLIVVDSVTAAHQTRIANAAARLTTDSFTWVIFDTGPFGATYAKALGLSAQTNSRDTVLALIGSPTERSRLQANRLEEETDVSLITIAEPDVDVSEIVNTIEEQAHRGCPVVGIRTTTHEGTEASNPANAEEMLAFITELARTCASRLELGGIYASGGDVGVAVLASLGATGYAVESEILPLAVCGAVVGGPFDGLGFATKGGLVGGPEAAVQCINQLRERRRTPQTISTGDTSRDAIHSLNRKGM